jgi:rubrerythrin
MVESKKPLAKIESLLGIHKRKDERQPETETVTIREEKKKVKRVVKAKPMSRRHLSEAFQARAVTKEEIDITESVIEGVAQTTASSVQEREVEPTFVCLECGFPVPASADRCPKCNTLYLKDVDEEQLDQEEANEDVLAFDKDEILPKDTISCIHFDAESGTINYLESIISAPDIEMECSNCGTLVGFDAAACPICGTKFETTDTGIVSLFADMDFDNDCSEDINCPLCGERIAPVNGRCPSCHEIVHEENPRDSDVKVEPVIRNENVVFLHLDVETGEVNFLQKLARRLQFERLTVKLDKISSDGFEHELDWKTLARI